MSVYISAAVWKSAATGGNTLLVLLALADQADDDGWCYPSVAYLARKCRLSERATQDNLARLEASGVLERHPRPGRSTYYRVRVDRLGGAESAPVRGAAPGGAGSRTGGVRPAAPITINEPSTEPLAEPSSDADGALPGMPEHPDRWDAGVVVAAWCRGYSEAHDGRQPPASVLNRVRGSARQAAKECATDGDRAAVLEVAGIAGAHVRYDVVAAIADVISGRLRQGAPASLSPASRNAAILARAAERNGEEDRHDTR